MTLVQQRIENALERLDNDFIIRKGYKMMVKTIFKKKETFVNIC
jgi:hypothetical protein